MAKDTYAAALLPLVALVMVAFAANSVLNRAALAGGQIAAADFAAIRLGSGAVVLAILASYRDGSAWATRVQPAGIASLAVYVIGFSFAYLSLDAGVGALILFGGVQVTMFAAAIAGGEALPARRWAGAALALLGLAWMLWPAGAAPVSLAHGALMVAAAIGWGVYSLLGRGASDPLGLTAANFLWAAPVAVLLAGIWPGAGGAGGVGEATARGMGLAVISGVVTSGLGYALWYAVLPRLARAEAALAQLTVPVIAVAGGVALLGEAISARLVLSGLLVCGGVALGVVRPRVTRRA